MILHILREKGPLHAYGIIKAFEEYTLNRYRPSTGALYPSLKRLIDEGYIVEYVEGGKKLYRISDKGLIAISLDPPLIEHIKKFVGSEAPYEGLYEAGRMIFDNWESLDEDKRRMIRELVEDFRRRVEEVVRGA